MKAICSNRQKSFRIPKTDLLERFILNAAKFAGLKLEKDQGVSINFLSPRSIRALNRKFLGHDRVTDVISFRYSELPPGGAEDAEDTAVEIFVCPAEARRYAGSDDAYPSEIALYIVHGLLHAAGMDDISPEEAALMRAAEARVLRALSSEFNLKEIFPPCNSKFKSI